MREHLAIVTLGTLFVLSVAAQVSDAVRQSVSRWLLLNVVPSWRFFGPNPMIGDMHLLFRRRSEGGLLGRWEEIWIPPQGRLRALWNPSRLEDKALADMVNAMLAVSHSLKRRISDEARLNQAIQFSQPYLALLAWVMDYGGQPTVREQRQFAVVESRNDGGAGHSLIFLSHFHSTS